ncbi:MAG: TrmH family RNA methyltransferase [Candidatus Harrisonbacteria bacterium]|nr:TrmH family RNA methyltransferase [Candidatus Harrisonbacteria bacterium]
MVVILDNIRSLHNTGSIFRTADAAGIAKIYLAGITPDPFDRFGRPRQQFVKVSLGAEKTVAWEKAKSAGRLMDKLKKEGYEIWAVEQDKKAIPYYKVILRPAQDKIALVFGNEVSGISRAILKKADKILEIPMRGKKESLNVAVAFGIVTFHFLYAK